MVVRDGRAAGVELEDGTEVPARAVVSGAYPQTMYLDLMARSTSRRRWSGTSAGTGPARAR